MRRAIVLTVFIGVFMTVGGPVWGEEEGRDREPITQWLVIGPLSQPLPSLAEVEAEKSLTQILDARTFAEEYRLPEGVHAGLHPLEQNLRAQAVAR